MNPTSPARKSAPRSPRLVLVSLSLAIAAIIGTVVYQSASSSELTLNDIVSGNQHGSLGEADGVVPDDTVTAFDKVPAVTNLDPDLLKALRQAATAAARDKVTFYVNSGWRSPAYQEQLLNEAILKYGSEKIAARWVSTPGKSLHVSGEAVDIGRSNARSWLSKHGAMYGLCQIYHNEPWHFELRPDAVEQGCPRLYVDPTRDPRMR